MRAGEEQPVSASSSSTVRQDDAESVREEAMPKGDEAVCFACESQWSNQDSQLIPGATSHDKGRPRGQAPDSTEE